MEIAMNEEIKAVALRYIEAMGRNDPDTAMACFLPTGVQHSMGNSGLSMTSTVERMRAGLEAFKQLLPGGLAFTIRSVTTECDRVVVECKGNGQTADGTPYHNEYCFVFTMRDGLIENSIEYFCTKLAEEVLLPRAKALGALTAD
jgi:hypothetical protein